MKAIKKRKTRISKKALKEFKLASQEDKSKNYYQRKKIASPGPWTAVETTINVNPSLRQSKGIMGSFIGAYKSDSSVERGWYEIVINIISENQTEIIKKHGLNNFLASCEKEFNTENNIKKYGKLILLKVLVDHSLDESRDQHDRFISCEAKTNKKSIAGFLAVKNRKYQIIKEKDESTDQTSL